MASSSMRGVLCRIQRPVQWQARGMHTSVSVYLPRQIARRSPSTPTSDPDRFVPSPAPADKDVPWYLRAQEHVEEERMEKRRRRKEIPIELTQPDVELPTALQGLRDLLTTGPPSPLIARPDEGDVEGETGRRPIVFVHTKQHDEQSWTDWMIVVQVRTSSGSAVSRVAREIGTYLRTAPPPSIASSTSVSSVDDGQASEEKRPWRPYKILSREAQDGMRLLHQNDPERWSRKALAETFRMSVESVRRILKSKWQPSSDIVARQNRRARERQEERRVMFANGAAGEDRTWQVREHEEIERIRQVIAQGNAGQQDNGNTSDVDAEENQYRLEGENEQRVVEQTIRYEGLVGSSNDPQATQSKAVSRARTGISRGDGEWCLVDAGWCVVHVMTAKARLTYDVERAFLT